MHIDDIRDFCLALPDVEETLPFGPDVLVFKTQGKIFLLLPLDADPLQFNVKCQPALAEELRENYSCVVPGYHMNKKHWNTVILDGSVKNALLKSWIEHSYHLVHKPPKNKSGRS